MNGRRCLIALAMLWVASSSSAAVHVPPQLKQSVVFLYGQEDDGQFGVGTGFVVSVKHETIAGSFYAYLVTAKHCIRRKSAGHPYYPWIQLRANRKDGTSEMVRLPMLASGPGKNVFAHDDPSVDIAVMPITLKPGHELEITFLDTSLVTGEDAFEKLGLGDGSDVFFTGNFLGYQGAKRNYPIVRFGRVALITPERIAVQDGPPARLYLVETQAFKGNSGSPVFFYLGGDRSPGGIVVSRPQILLAGVMTVAWEDQGVAGITPAYLLREILFGSELTKVRSSAK